MTGKDLGIFGGQLMTRPDQTVHEVFLGVSAYPSRGRRHRPSSMVVVAIEYI